MVYTGSTGNTNYSPYIIPSTQIGKLKIKRIVHPTQFSSSGVPVLPKRGVSVTGSYSANLSDAYIGVSAAAAMSITLPPASNGSASSIPKVNDGVEIVVKDELGNAATNNITITANGTELIEGSASKVINTNYGSLRLRWVGASWVII